MATAHGLAWLVEAPLLRSVGQIASGFRTLGRDTSRLQTGLVRVYVLAIAAGVAVMVVVFVAVR